MVESNCYSKETYEQDRTVVQKLKELMILRNTHPAFSLDGTIEIQTNGDRLIITRKYGSDSITLKSDLTTYRFEIETRRE